MELESYDDGQLLYAAVEEGNAVAVDGVIAIIGEVGADYKALLAAENNEQEIAVVISEVQTPIAPTVIANALEQTSLPISNDRILASPFAKKIAQEKGIDLKVVSGSGEGGRIIKKDVQEFVPSPKAAVSPAKPISVSTLSPMVGVESTEEIPLSQMRKVIASRLAASKFSAPHFYLTMEINMDKAIEARISMNEVASVKISFNDMVVKAVAAAIRQNPNVNVSWLGDKMVRHQHIHIGVAVAIPDGLVVPVVKFADNKSLSYISAEVKDLAQRAVAKKLSPDEFT